MANFDAAKAIFSQVDANKDGSIDQNEFRSWASGPLNSASSSSNLAVSGVQGVNAYQTGDLANGYQSSSSSSNELVQSSDTALASNNIQQTTQYSSTDIYKDPSPLIIRRAATTGSVTYQQKILVRFLQPPPVPPPGPLIIKEIRPLQPPPPPPLVVRQKAPSLPQPPPLILRERPPVAPTAVASQTIVRRLPALPVPPRSVIIERLPALPPKPRDIIIERWVPYGPQAKRRTIVQRAAAAQQYPRPRNIVVQYEPVQVRIVRQFQKLGVTQENPQAYLTRYGASLLDSTTLIQQARAAGVVEDISPPAVAQINTASLSSTEAISTSIGNSNISYGITGGSEFDASAFNGLQVIGGGNNLSSSSLNYNSQGLGFDVAAASFTAADTNKDGSLDKGEFQRFIQGGR